MVEDPKLCPKSCKSKRKKKVVADNAYAFYGAFVGHVVTVTTIWSMLSFFYWRLYLFLYTGLKWEVDSNGPKRRLRVGTLCIDFLSAWTSCKNSFHGTAGHQLGILMYLHLASWKACVWLMTIKYHKIERIQSFYETKSHLLTPSLFCPIQCVFSRSWFIHSPMFSCMFIRFTD